MKKTFLLALAIVSTSTIQAQFTDNGTNTTTSDNVGIGTLTPNYAGYGNAHVLSIGENNAGILELSSALNSNTIGKIDFYGTGISERLASITAFKSADKDSQLRFYTKPTNGSISEVMRINKDGNVGIGTQTPNYAGNGNAHVLSVGNNYPGILELSSALNSNTIGKIDFYGTGISERLASITAFKSTDKDSQLRFYTKPTDGSISEVMRINKDGNVGIGTTSTGGHMLAVKGSIGAREIKVEMTDWQDRVFEENYDLKSLEDTEKYIAENNHLPEIPSEREVIENGVNLGDMVSKLLQKIEENTLHMIDMNKRMKQLEVENKELKEHILK